MARHVDWLRKRVRPIIQKRQMPHRLIHVSGPVISHKGTTLDERTNRDARLGLLGNKVGCALTDALGVSVEVHTHTLGGTTAGLTTGLCSTKATAGATDAAQAGPAEFWLFASLAGLSAAGPDAGLRAGRIDQLTSPTRVVGTRVGLEHVASPGGKAQADVGRHIGAAVVVLQAQGERT